MDPKKKAARTEKKVQKSGISIFEHSGGVMIGGGWVLVPEKVFGELERELSAVKPIADLFEILSPAGSGFVVVRLRESVEVVVKDRGPAKWIYDLGIHLDLSTASARAIHLGQNGRFESGWTCHSVVSVGSGAALPTRRGGKYRERPVSVPDYMSRMGAGI